MVDRIPTPKTEEISRCSNKELKVSRELRERVRSLKEYATLGKLMPFLYVSGVPWVVYKPFRDKEARNAFYDF